MEAEIAHADKAEERRKEALPLNCVPALNRKTDKQMFVIKVYGLLTCTLAFTMLASVIVYTSAGVQAWMQANQWMHWVAVIGGFTLAMVLMCPCFSCCRQA